MRLRRKLYGVLLVVFITCAGLRAQENAELSGTVTDPSGAVVPNATVTLTNTATGEIRTATSNGAGLYFFPGLNHGIYDMKVDAQGFTISQKSNIVMNVAATVQENVVLQIGRASCRERV